MLQLLIGAVMISFSAVFVKLIAVPPTATAFYRMLAGGAILLVVALVRRERLWSGWRSLAVVAVAAFLFALDLAFWHRSILFVGPGIATLLANFQVFLLAAAGVLVFGEALRWQLSVGVLLAMVGLVMLVGAGWSHLSADYHLGVGFGLLTALCYSGYILALRHSRIAPAGSGNASNMAVLSLICAAFLAVFAVAEGESFAIPQVMDGVWLLAYGIFGQVLGWLLISQSLAKVRASQVGLVLLLQPTLAFIWDAAFFGHRFSTVQIVGAALALVAIYLGSQKRSGRNA